MNIRTDNSKVKCKGVNCSAINGNNHSPECVAEHNAVVSKGAGNRNPEYRYRGYKNEPLKSTATPDQKAAWLEGKNAQLVRQQATEQEKGDE